MPTYQYVCTDCGDASEVQQSFSDESLTICPTCTGRLRKVFNAVGVVFKGSGFYRNDSRSPSAESKSADGSGESGSKEKATTGSSEAKGSGETKSKPSADSGGKSDGASSGSVKPATGSAA